VEPSNGSLCNLGVFREFRPTSGFGQAVGNNIWDANDTEGNGTFVKGHAPHLFESGTATTSAAGGRLIDNTKNWVPNQWAGYSIKRANINAGANIISNTSNTISYYYYTDNTGKFKPLIFNAGDKYQIHKVLIALDQNGRGKGDLLSGNPAINTSTGAANWPHQALEPCYSWNNVYAANGHELGFRSGASGQTTTKPGVDYFNLGGGFPANSTPSAVSSRYTAALNGVDYTGTFIYPHPLTLLPVGTPRAVISDLNGDSRPDYVLQRASTQQTGIWYLDNNVYAGSAEGPTLPPDWDVVAAADFNGDGHSDYLLYNASIHQTGIYYLHNNAYAGSTWGPTLPPGWDVVAAADFNGDGHSDYLLYNASTHQTGIYYLDNNVLAGSAWGPTTSPGWSLFGGE
jgi:hypothetical protein